MVCTVPNELQIVEQPNSGLHAKYPVKQCQIRRALTAGCQAAVLLLLILILILGAPLNTLAGIRQGFGG